MSYIHPIIFTFGTNIHRDITIEQIEYLKNFFSAFFDVQYNIKESLINIYKTIPISYGKISKYGNILSIKLQEYLISKYKIIDSDKKFNNQSDIIVIDVKANLRDVTILSLSSEIESILRYDVNNNPRFIIIVDNIPAILASFYSIKKYILNGKVLLIDKKKRYIYKNEEIKINKSFSFNNLSKTAIIKMRFKLVRKIGHYGRFEDKKRKNKIACNQFFYDCLDCTSDISDALFDKIVELNDKENFNISKIIYHGPESPWLEDALTLLNTDLQNLKYYYNLNYQGYENINKINGNEQLKENILFIVSLIHTGKTFKREYQKLKVTLPNSPLKIISVLISDSGIHLDILDNNYIKINITEEESILVNYLLRVNQIQYLKFQSCPMCHKNT